MRILLVHHVEKVRETLGRLLAGVDDAETRIEPDAAHAIDRAHAWRPHLALLALEMPVVNGVDCARALRLVDPALPMIFLAQQPSLASSSLAVAAQSLGATLIFARPFDHQAILVAAESFRP